jgi:hypothetical protein
MRSDKDWKHTKIDLHNLTERLYSQVIQQTIRMMNAVSKQTQLFK